MSNGDVQFQGGGFLPVTTASFSVYNPGLTGFVQYQPYFPPVALPSPQGESTTSRLRRNTAESDWSGQFGEIDNLRASEYHPAGYIISPIPPGEEICQFANGNGDGLGPEDIYEVEVGRAESFRIPQQSDGCGSLSSSTKSRGGGEVPPRFLKNLQRRQHHGGFSTNFSYANGRQAWPAAFDIWSNSPVEADWEYQQGADGGAQPVEFTVGRWDQASFGHQHAFQPDYYAAHNSRHWSQPGPSQSHPRPNRQPPPTGYGANLVRRHNKYLTNSDAQTGENIPGDSYLPKLCSRPHLICRF